MPTCAARPPQTSFEPPASQTREKEENQSVHLSDKLVDVAFPVTKVSTLDEVLKFTLSPATGRVRELEGPKEVRCLKICNLTNMRSNV